MNLGISSQLPLNYTTNLLLLDVVLVGVIVLVLLIVLFPVVVYEVVLDVAGDGLGVELVGGVLVVDQPEGDRAVPLAARVLHPLDADGAARAGRAEPDVEAVVLLVLGAPDSTGSGEEIALQFYVYLKL